MPAPKGNQFWKMRSKHGRDRIFETPQILWEAACEYFENVDQNPDKVEDYVGKDAEKVYREKKRPYSMKGLAIFLGIASTEIFTMKKTFSERDDQQSKDFLNIITRIEDIVYTCKYEGAVIGYFKENIIARESGFSEKIEQEIKMESKQVFQIGDTIIEM